MHVDGQAEAQHSQIGLPWVPYGASNIRVPWSDAGHLSFIASSRFICSMKVSCCAVTHTLSLCRGKTMGILGLGGIGQEVARLALALGMRVLGLRRQDTGPAPMDGVQVRIHTPTLTKTVVHQVSSSDGSCKMHLMSLTQQPRQG